MKDLYIDGAWVGACGAEAIPVVDPATESVIASVASGQAADVDRAVDAAGRALRGPWGDLTGRERASILRAVAVVIRERADEIARIEVRDNGKPFPEAALDVGDAAYCFDYYATLAEELDGRQGELIALADDRFRCALHHEPIGVVGLIVPWNYPFLIASWKVAPALAAGCTIVLKPSEVTPLTALLLAECAAKGGLPPGVLNVVTGFGATAGAALARHPEVAKLSFTGSVPTGKAILSATGSSLKAVSLELGGKSPLILFADADLDTAVEWIMLGIFWNQGQICAATSRLLVDASIYDDVLERLVAASRRIAIGPGLEPGVQLGPLVSNAHREKVESYIRGAEAAGARIVTGGGRPAHLDTGFYVEPTIIDRAAEDAAVWRDEIFGPVLCVRPFSSEGEAVAAANNSRFGLAAAVMSADEQRCDRVAKRLQAGIVWINCNQPAFVEAPWGGVKDSGIGRELGRAGLENFLSVKQVTRYASEEPWVWYDR